MDGVTFCNYVYICNQSDRFVSCNLVKATILTCEKFAKNQEKEEKMKKGGKIRQKLQKLGLFFHIALPDR